MARRTRKRRFSKRVAGGLAFVVTGIVGGFFSSVGIDVYHTIKSAVFNDNGFPITFPQILFLLIGLAGLGLLLSGVVMPPSKPRVKKRT
ncbi:MAG: hypothetical protein ACHQ1H_03145 [Nitrososphaerales archaeon]